jgi:hypothetical protein
MTEPDDPDLEMARSVVVITTGVANFPDWTFLAQWLAAGCTLWEDVVPAIEARIRANRERDPTWYPRNLGCFDKAVRQARRRRVMEALATTTDAPPVDGGERAAPHPACTCLWCGTTFQPRADGGTPQRFCNRGCRRALDHASRAWVRRQVDAGLLSVADLRDGPGTARALHPETYPPLGVER